MPDVQDVAAAWCGDPELGRCDKCGTKTRWVRAKRGNWQNCSGCNDRFPCKRRCDHLDCAEVRGEVTVLENGFVVLNDQPTTTETETQETEKMKRKPTMKAKNSNKHGNVTRKECTHCGVVKAASKFRVDNSRPSGLMSWCSDCFDAKRKKTIKSQSRAQTGRRKAG